MFPKIKIEFLSDLTDLLIMTNLNNLNGEGVLIRCHLIFVHVIRRKPSRALYRNASLWTDGHIRVKRLPSHSLGIVEFWIKGKLSTSLAGLVDLMVQEN